MKVNLLSLLLFFIASLPVHAGEIDLRCEELAEKMIERLASEELLDSSNTSRQRAHAISLELCSGAQNLAVQQHEKGKRQAIEKWFFESTGGKPGNKRLRKLK